MTLLHHGPEPKRAIIRKSIICEPNDSTEAEFTDFMYQDEWELGIVSKISLSKVKFRGHKLFIGAVNPNRLIIEAWLIGEDDVFVQPINAGVFANTGFSMTLDMPIKNSDDKMTMFLLSEIRQEVIITVLGRVIDK